MKTRIGGYDFEVRQIYSPGKKINQGEADALNRVRAVTIGSYFRTEVKEVVSKTTDGKLSESEFNALQAKISQYDKDFMLTAGRTRPKKDSKAPDVIAFARLMINKDIHSSGMTVKQYKLTAGNGDMEAGVAIYNERVRKLAAKPAVAKKITELAKMTS